MPTPNARQVVDLPHKVRSLADGDMVYHDANGRGQPVADKPADSDPTPKSPVIRSGVVAWEDAGEASGRYSVMVNGDPTTPDLVYDADGDVIELWLES